MTIWSPKQYADALDLLAHALVELTERIRQTGDNDEACVDIEDAIGNLHAAAKWLRDPVRE